MTGLNNDSALSSCLSCHVSDQFPSCLSRSASVLATLLLYCFGRKQAQHPRLFERETGICMLCLGSAYCLKTEGVKSCFRVEDRRNVQVPVKDTSHQLLPQIGY